MFMQGGPSHVDTFDYKPALERDDGKSPSEVAGKGSRKLHPFVVQRRGAFVEGEGDVGHFFANVHKKSRQEKTSLLPLAHIAT